MTIEKDSPLHLALVLFIFCTICALILAGVNQITAPKILALQEARTKEALKAVAADGDDFLKIALSEGKDPLVIEAYTIKKGGQDMGYCVLTRPNGFGGPLDLMVGINKEGTVLGVKIVTLKETPGIGTKANDDKWLSQFEMKHGTMKLTKTPTGAEDEVMAISGATVTSTAVTAGVQAALNFAQGRGK